MKFSTSRNRISRVYLKNTLAEEIKIFRGIFIVLVINCVYFSKCVRILSKLGVCLKSKKIKQTSFSVNSLIRARRRCGCRAPDKKFLEKIILLTFTDVASRAPLLLLMFVLCVSESHQVARWSNQNQICTNGNSRGAH